MYMDASQRGALMLVRFVAGCVMVISLLDIGLYYKVFRT